MTHIRALFWDIGGVLLSNGWDRDQRAKLVEQFALDPEDFGERHKLIVPELEAGRLTLDAYLDQTIFFQRRPFSHEDFVQALFAQSQPHPDTLVLARKLAGLGQVRMYSLNNESRELNAHRIETFKLNDFLLGFFSSCYLGMTKPSPLIYKLALDLAHVAPGEAVMIDDRIQNVEAARRVGMHAVQYQEAGQLAAALAELGVALPA